MENRHRNSGPNAQKRLTALIGMAPDVAAAGDYDKTDVEIYGLGTVRPVELFYKLFMVDVIKRKAVSRKTPGFRDF